MGGVVGGLVGGLLGGSGGLLGGIANNLIGNIVGDLVDRFGFGDIAQAITNLAGDLLQNGLNSIIDSLPIPSFLKDLAKDAVANIIGQEQADVNPEAQDAVNEELGGTIDDIINGILDNVREAMEEESGETEGGQSGGSNNWLVVLAKALGKVAGEHLKRMVEIGDEMAALSDGGNSMSKEDKAAAMAEMQAEFQAEAQMFKMTQESISTMIKSVGEGLSAVARKQ